MIIISDRSNVHLPQPVTLERQGTGRPKKIVDQRWLREAFSTRRRISISKAAKAIGIHRHTLRRNMQRYNMQRSFTNLSDHHVDLIVRAFRSAHPATGVRYLRGFLLGQGVQISKARLYASLRRVDPVGRVLRRRRAVQRRKYRSTRPNALWHCDGHHKLILWGIVIHGFIDGYCRTVCGYNISLSLQNR